METFIDGVMVTLVLTNLAVLGSSRLIFCIRVIALQGVVLAGLPLVTGEDVPGLRMGLLTAVTLGLKGVAFPWLLMRAVRVAEVKREMEPYVGYGSSVLVGLGSLAACAWLAGRLPIAPEAHSLVGPVALFTIFAGIFVIVSRRKALSQILGYIMLENGVYAFGAAALGRIPELVELGILLDAFVAVFVMGVAVYHISREFDHIDADQLDSLKG